VIGTTVQELFGKIGKNLTLSQEIEIKIEDSIRQKKLEPGQKLPSEKELGVMFGVSRTAVREALRMLSARGLLNVRKGDGIYVNAFSSSHASKPMSLYLELQFDSDSILHLVHLRQMIEPNIARLAAENCTDADLALFEANLASFADRSQDAPKLAQLDVEFHTLIACSTHNPLIPLIMDPIFSMLPRVKTLIVNHLQKAHSDNAPNYHQKIYDMIKARDAEGAFAAMQEHLKIAEHDSLQLTRWMKENAISPN
jgi:GntR family transcriptional repressor for pyruvate dehydrogenase complex